MTARLRLDHNDQPGPPDQSERLTWVQDLPVVAWSRDRKGRLVAASAWAREVCGEALDGVLALADQDWFQDPDRRGETGLAPAQELRMGDGTASRILAVRRQVVVDDGVEVGLVAFAEDLTKVVIAGQLRASEEHRIERERSLLELAEHAAIAGCFELEPETGAVRCTPSLLRLLGISSSMTPTWALVRGCFVPEAWESLDLGVRRAWELGESFERELEVARDGERAWVRVVARREHDGGETRVLGSIRDVDRRRTEEVALARLAASLGGATSERFSAGVVRALAEAFRLDAVLLFELGSVARELELVSGFREGAALAPRGPARPSPACQQVLVAGRMTVVEGAGRRFPEDPWVAGCEGWMGVVLRGEGGCPLGILVLASRRPLSTVGLLVPMLEIVAGRLVAEIAGRRAQEQLREARAVVHRAYRLEALATFVGGVAHDLNNLLTVLFGRLDLAASALPAHHPVQAELAGIEKVGLSAEGLSRQLLTFSKPRAECRIDLDLGEVVLDLEDVLRPLVNEQAQLELRARPGCGWVRADRGEIEQILVNLVVNARDASPAGGLILVELIDGWLDAASAGELGGLAPGPWRGLVVADQGIGIDPELEVHIFDPFFTTKAEGKGSGLGLATVREIADRLGGHVTVARRPGWGAVFVVYLPAVSRPESAHAGVRDGGVEALAVRQRSADLRV